MWKKRKRNRASDFSTVYFIHINIIEFAMFDKITNFLSRKILLLVNTYDNLYAIPEPRSSARSYHDAHSLQSRFI